MAGTSMLTAFDFPATLTLGHSPRLSIGAQKLHPETLRDDGWVIRATHSPTRNPSKSRAALADFGPPRIGQFTYFADLSPRYTHPNASFRLRSARGVRQPIPKRKKNMMGINLLMSNPSPPLRGAAPA